MSHSQQKRPCLDAVLEHVMRQLESPKQALELFYWTREPDLLEAVRAIAAMSPQSRATLCAFLAVAGDAESVDADMDRNGNLTLTAPGIPEGLAQVIDTYEAPIEIAPQLTPRIH